MQFDQRVRSTRPLVDLSEAGALELAERYWREVEAVTRRLVRARHVGGGVELRLFGRWTLLRFGAPETIVDEPACPQQIPDRRRTAGARTRGLDHASRRPSSPRSSCARRSTGSSLASGADRAARLDRRALPARPATHPHERQPPLLPAPDRSRSQDEGRRLRRDRHDRSAARAARSRATTTSSQSRAASGRTSGGVTWVRADAADPSRWARRSQERTSPTTSSTRSDPPTSSSATASRPRRSPRAASAAGVRQIVYLGGLGDDSPDLSPHLRSRLETGRALAAGAACR